MNNSSCACPEGTIHNPSFAIVMLALAGTLTSLACARLNRTIERLEARIEQIATQLQHRDAGDQPQSTGELDEPTVNGRVVERGRSARERGAGDSGFPGLE